MDHDNSIVFQLFACREGKTTTSRANAESGITGLPGGSFAVWADIAVPRFTCFGRSQQDPGSCSGRNCGNGV